MSKNENDILFGVAIVIVIVILLIGELFLRHDLALMDARITNIEMAR